MLQPQAGSAKLLFYKEPLFAQHPRAAPQRLPAQGKLLPVSGRATFSVPWS